MQKITKLKTHDIDCIRIVQVSDTHLFGQPESRIDEVDSRESLSRVIAHIKQELTNIDVVLLTGDLVHAPEEQAYERLRSELMNLDSPVFCLPGNHDEPNLMEAMLNQDSISTAKTLDFEKWRIILLNSYVPGTNAGALSASELDFLKSGLQEAHNKYILLAVHHHPISINSPWMDSMMLENGSALFKLIDRFPQVQGIICGHVHQDFVSVRNEVQIFSCPSSCVQFMPRATEYKKDSLGPGYRKLLLTAGGGIETSARWLSQ